MGIHCTAVVSAHHAVKGDGREMGIHRTAVVSAHHAVVKGDGNTSYSCSVSTSCCCEGRWEYIVQV